MFSQTVEYALRAAAHLAAQHPSPRTADQIAQATQVPRYYLSKILRNLVRAGVLRSQRGIGGGLSLAKSTEQLTILEIVNGVEPIRRIRSCPLGLVAHKAQLCPLHSRLDEAMEMVENALRTTTLAQLLEVPRKQKQCHFPRVRVSAG